eukprot:4241205-Amphidinium_carterae.2
MLFLKKSLLRQNANQILSPKKDPMKRTPNQAQPRNALFCRQVKSVDKLCTPETEQCFTARLRDKFLKDLHCKAGLL